MLSDDPERLDNGVVGRCLAEPHRCPAPPGTRDREQALVLFGLYDGGEQVGFAAAAPDASRRTATIDLFLPGSRRGILLCRWLAEVVGSHPRLCGMRLDLSVSGLPRPRGPLRASRRACRR